MTNLEKYINTFVTAFDVQKDQLENLKYQDIDAWDSIGHMTLITTIEETFSIMLDTDDIVDLSSFARGKEILKKYDLEF